MMMKESRHIEFKKSFGKEVIISLAAFANTEGGKVDAYPVQAPMDALDQGLLDKFCEKVSRIGRMSLLEDPLTNLIKLNLVKEGRPTLASLLLFGSHTYAIHIGRFKSADTIIDDLLLKEPLVVSLPEAMIFIQKHINLSFHFDGSLERKEMWQYPLEAVRELLLNAVVHRDYKNTSDIVIKIFDDRIEFSNPGTLYGNLRIQDLARDDYVSSIRNKLLAEAFYLMGDIEKYGTGFIRIRKHLVTYPGISLEIKEIGDYFKAVLVSALPEHRLTEQVPNKSDLLDFCQPPKSIQEMMVHFNLKHRPHFISNYLKPLMESGAIHMTIPDKPTSSKQRYVATEISDGAE